jgi:hypothetical protein
MLILTLDNSLSFHLRILVGRDTPLTIVFLASAQPSSKSGYQDKSSPASHHRSFPNDELLAAEFAVHHSPVDGTSARDRIWLHIIGCTSRHALLQPH